MFVQMSQNLKQRLIFSFIATLLIFIAVYFSHVEWLKPIFTLLVATIISIALWEFNRLAQAKGYHLQLQLCIIGTFGYAFSLWLRSQTHIWNILPESVLGLTLLVAFTSLFRKGSQPLITLALTFFAIFYLTVPLSCLISINYLFADSAQDGRWWLFYLIGVTKMTDIGAFGFGKSLGKHPLAPFISPKKTLEGTYGGLLVGILTSVAFYAATSFFYAVPPLRLTFFDSLWLGGLISIFAQIGDLAESLLKRDAGIKDSNQLPGLGGFLDILDSVIFTAPLLYLFLQGRYGP